MKSYFLSDSDLRIDALTLEEIQLAKFKRAIADSAVYRTVNQLCFMSETARGIITVPAGYLTDFASIPKLAQGIFIVHDDPVILRPSVVHDLLYGCKGRIQVIANGRQMDMLLTRQQCDFILCHEAMAACGATSLQVFTVYQALRVFGDSWGSNYPLSERWETA